MVDIRQRKRTFLVYFSIICVSVILLSIYLKNNTTNVESKASDNTEISGSLVDISGIPDIINLAPDKAYEEEYFRHTFQIIDSDTDLYDLDIELVESPDWMNLVGFEIIGWPEVGTNATQKVTIEVSDGENVVSESFYIYVTEKE